MASMGYGGSPHGFDGLPPCRPVRTHALWHTCGIICTTRYVVDAGFCKLKCYNPKIGMDSLLVTPISQVYSAGRSRCVHSGLAAEDAQIRSFSIALLLCLGGVR
jgi:hypothetical protein